MIGGDHRPLQPCARAHFSRNIENQFLIGMYIYILAFFRRCNERSRESLRRCWYFIVLFSRLYEGALYCRQRRRATFSFLYMCVSVWRALPDRYSSPARTLCLRFHLSVPRRERDNIDFSRCTRFYRRREHNGSKVKWSQFGGAIMSVEIYWMRNEGSMFIETIIYAYLCLYKTVIVIKHCLWFIHMRRAVIKWHAKVLERLLFLRGTYRLMSTVISTIEKLTECTRKASRN